MKITKRKFLGVALPSLALAASGVRAWGQSKLGNPAWTYDLVIGGGSATGNSRIFASAIGKIITENVQGVRASGGVSPGYDAESAMHVYDGTMVGGVGTPLIIQNAVAGKPPFPPSGIDLKFWFSHNEIPLNLFARGETGFTQISQLKGATVGLAPEGTSNYILSKIVFEANGVPMSSLKVRYMDTSKAVEQLQNGNIDAMSYVRDYSGAVLELTGARKVTLLQPSQESLTKIKQEIEWAGPADWSLKDRYPAMNVPAPGLAFVSPEFMFLSGKLPNDLVYAMTRAVWEHVSVLQESSNVYKHVNLKDALKRVPIQPHPGALVYYKEQNVPGWERYESLLPKG
ncbi:MAG: TAXI family TRAP transporter solute-binding subunit [Pseudolabrys sp.]